MTEIKIKHLSRLFFSINNKLQVWSLILNGFYVSWLMMADKWQFYMSIPDTAGHQIAVQKFPHLKLSVSALPRQNRITKYASK